MTNGITQTRLQELIYVMTSQFICVLPFRNVWLAIVVTFLHSSLQLYSVMELISPRNLKWYTGKSGDKPVLIRSHNFTIVIKCRKEDLNLLYLSPVSSKRKPRMSEAVLYTVRRDIASINQDGNKTLIVIKPKETEEKCKKEDTSSRRSFQQTNPDRRSDRWSPDKKSDDHRRDRTCNLLISRAHRSQTHCHYARRPAV